MELRLIDFLNHGILPFVGRLAEVERVMGLWRGNSEFHHLRAMLISGESGIGKSRLIEEITPRISQQGGAVLHTKLYPETSTSIASLQARALRFLNTRRGLMIEEPEEKLLSVISSLRRLARLRPTLLIIEDIHLLNTETTSELAMMLEAISDEQLSVLCLARPVELGVRGILERYVVDELELKGLNIDEIAIIWEQLFGAVPPPEILNQVCSATIGNPLALRSALRGIVKSGALTHDPLSNTWHPAIAADTFGQIVQRNVRVLSEGLAAHLTPDARQTAVQIAALGEVFSREAARAVSQNNDALIESLGFRGIIIASNTPVAPISGQASGFPVLAFTHTILHNHLLRQGTHDVQRLIQIIASDIPLYSVAPFQLISESTITPSLPPEEAYQAAMRAIEVSCLLDTSTDWRLAMAPWRAAQAIKEAYQPVWSKLQELTLSAELISARLMLLRRTEDHNEYERLVMELLQLTDEPVPEPILEYRLLAFTYLHSLGRRKDTHLCHQAWGFSRAFVGRHPQLRYTPRYISYLDSAARSMLYMGEFETLREIERELSELAASPYVTDDYRYLAKHKVAVHFLDMFDTEEELQERLKLLADLETHSEERKMSFLIFKLGFLVDIGQMEDALRTSAEALQLFRERGLTHNLFYGSLNRLCAVAALGMELPTVEAEMMRLCGEAPGDISHRFRTFAETALVEIGLLHGDRQWLRQSIAQGGLRLDYLRPESQALLKLEEGVECETLSASTHLTSQTFKPLLEAWISPLIPEAGSIETASRSALRAPILRVQDLLERRAVLGIIAELEQRLGKGSLIPRLHDDIIHAVELTLHWLSERKLFPYMRPMVALFGKYLPKGVEGAWQTRMGQLQAQQASTHTTASQQRRTILTMLGSIESGVEGEAPSPVRGARLRALLGVMVADRMLDERLDYREFCHIVTGIDDDPDRARKTLNGIVFRLREMLGHEIINTESETPELNLECVEVDILIAYQHIQNATAALRSESLIRSQRELLKALEYTCGEVPFPGLYEPFFEAVRDDFEGNVRALILKVARHLVNEQDLRSAEELLRPGFSAMPHDEELADLLYQTLRQLGKRADAERVRMKLSEAMAS